MAMKDFIIASALMGMLAELEVQPDEFIDAEQLEQLENIAGQMEDKVTEEELLATLKDLAREYIGKVLK